MATVTESDLQEIKDLINGLDKKIDVNQARIEEKISGLDKRMEIIEGRINGLTGWLIGILFALVTGLLGLLGKVTFFPNP
jgi:hypothetical protein